MNDDSLIINTINTHTDLHLSSSSLNTECNEMEMIDLCELQESASYSKQNNAAVSNLKKGNLKTSSTITPEGSNVELKKIYDDVIISDIAFDTFLFFLTKLSKKDVNTEEIRKLYSKQFKELIEILETLRGVTKSAMKARITRTTYKMKNIFKYPASEKSSSASGVLKDKYNESENNTMESL